MKFQKIPKNTPTTCGYCKDLKELCYCACHKEALVPISTFHEIIEGRPLEFNTLEKIRHVFVTKLKLKVASI